MAETRRAALKQMLVLLGGVGGLVAGRSAASAASTQCGAGGQTFTLHGRDWHIFSRDLARGELPTTGDRMLVYGDLLEDAEGEKVGEFVATYISLHRPDWVDRLASIEQHTFNLPGGSIMGSGTTKPGLESEDEFAIVWSQAHLRWRTSFPRRCADA